MTAYWGKKISLEHQRAHVETGLQEDSTVLEQTLCEANTLLGESADIPMVIASNRDAISTGTSKSAHQRSGGKSGIQEYMCPRARS
jgi:hypothetical protein